MATGEFNRAIQPYTDRMVNECETGGSYVVRLGRSRVYPKIFVTVSINRMTQRLEVSASRITELGTEALPPTTFLLEVAEDLVEVHDAQGFIQYPDLAARLLQYFV